jgi:hypothetical protein
MSNQGPFPNLGAGFWMLDTPGGDQDLGIGFVSVNNSGELLKLVYGASASFVSSKTPVRSGSNYNGRTLTYQFFKMGS